MITNGRKLYLVVPFSPKVIGQMLSRGASPVRTAQLSYYLRRFSVDSDDYIPKPKQWNKDPFHVEQKPRVTAQPQHAESVVPYPVLPGPNPYINPLYKRPVTPK